MEPTSNRYPKKKIDDYGYILHPDPTHWKGKTRVSSSSSSDGLTDEQEREIAENIYDWWISGMSYKRWYAERFLQYELEFDGYL